MNRIAEYTDTDNLPVGTVRMFDNGLYVKAELGSLTTGCVYLCWEPLVERASCASEEDFNARCVAILLNCRPTIAL